MSIEDKIEKISSKGVSQDFQTEKLERTPNKDYFEELMQQRSVKTEVLDQQKALAIENSSLIDQVRELGQKTNTLSRATPAELAKQADDVIAQIDTLKEKLQTPDLELKGSMQTILKNKLSHIDENLKVALEKAGLEYVPPAAQNKTLMHPIERFLGLLTHGQSQLQTLTNDVQIMAQKGGQLSPADMLLVQIKVGHIQQEIELFTSMLNKALESTKTIMNVQV